MKAKEAISQISRISNPKERQSTLLVLAADYMGQIAVNRNAKSLAAWMAIYSDTKRWVNAALDEVMYYDWTVTPAARQDRIVMPNRPWFDWDGLKGKWEELSHIKFAELALYKHKERKDRHEKGKDKRSRSDQSWHR